MTDSSNPDVHDGASRRDFIKKSSILVAGAGVSGSLSVARSAHAQGSDEIKFGLVGCGGRGTKAAVQVMNTKGPTRLVAMADVFPDRLQASLRGIKGEHADKVDVPPERQFVGFDGYKQVLDEDIDIVLLTTPPHFRPMHFEAAVAAGKHVFFEKPLAVDAPGVRRILAAGEEAGQRGLAVAVGLQRHHEPRYIDTIARVKEGAIGNIIAARAYWNSTGVWVRERKPSQTEMEYQMRNWYYFNWICGDHIVEQHIHNLDVINWVLDAYPVTAHGMGGRQIRTGIDHGQIYDHHSVEFTYANGVKLFSQCRHMDHTWSNVSEHVHGTEGSANLIGNIYDTEGRETWKYGRGGGEGHQQEHHDLFASLRAGERPNETEYGAYSTMTAIMGRMATYSGKEVKWEDALNSAIDLSPAEYAWDADPPVMPDANGRYPIPVPGETVVI